MADRAQITSVEAIASFRADLLVYVSKARTTLDEVSGDVLRTRLWLQNDQRRHWEGEALRRGRRLEEARQQLFSQQLSQLDTSTGFHQLAVHRAERAVAEAEAKLKLLRKWNREFENLSQPLVKQAEQLHTYLTTDMMKAAHHLGELLETLDAYLDAGQAQRGSSETRGKTGTDPARPGDGAPAAKATPTGLAPDAP